MDATIFTTFEPQRTDDLIRMWRESFEHGVGIVDTHSLEEQRKYFVDEILCASPFSRWLDRSPFPRQGAPPPMRKMSSARRLVTGHRIDLVVGSNSKLPLLMTRF
jgi:hypothetical protein